MKTLAKFLSALGLLSLFAFAPLAAEQAAASPKAPSVAIVDFRKCVEESLLGQHEKEAFDSMKNQMQQSLEQKEKELTELTAKCNDADFMDSLAPEAEAEMKEKYRTLTQEIGQIQNRFYQMLNQANFKIIQNISSTVSDAAKAVAKSMGYDMVLNEETCFYFTDAHDITKQVISEMNTRFAKATAEQNGSSEAKGKL